jgi:hypothetical protein
VHLPERLRKYLEIEFEPSNVTHTIEWLDDGRALVKYTCNFELHEMFDPALVINVQLDEDPVASSPYYVWMRKYILCTNPADGLHMDKDTGLDDLVQEYSNLVPENFRSFFVNDMYPKSIPARDVLMDEVDLMRLLSYYNSTIKMVFRHYICSFFSKNSFAMNSTQFHQFVKDLRLHQDINHREGVIFKLVNQDIHNRWSVKQQQKSLSSKDSSVESRAVQAIYQTKKGSDQGGQTTMMIGEFAEALMRLAKAQFEKEQLLSSCLELFMDKHFVPYAQVFVLDDFRIVVMQNEAIQAALSRFSDELHKVYAVTAMPKKFITMNDFFSLIGDAGLIDSKLTLQTLGEIFMLSNFEEEDMDGWDDWEWNMEYDELVEALLRILNHQLESKKLLKPKEYNIDIIAKSTDPFLSTFLKSLAKSRNTGMTTRLKSFRAPKVAGSSGKK